MALELPSCDLRGAQSPNPVNFLEIEGSKNHYSIVEAILDLKSCPEIVISQDIG